MRRLFGMRQGTVSARKLQRLLKDHPWADRIHLLETVDSTNTYAKALGAQGAPDGTVVIAEQQTGGRGRLGRSFSSPKGAGIYLSVILRPAVRPEQILHLTCACAAAMCDAVEAACGLRPGVKWTNDLIVGDKKLAGILTELSIQPENGRIQYAVVGVGINCRQKKEDFPPDVQEKACSLEMVLGKLVDQNRLAAEMLRAFGKLEETLLSDKAKWMDQYRRDCVTLGREIAVVRGDAARRGTALDIDADGGLLVRYENGEEETVAFGEVSVRGLYGYV